MNTNNILKFVILPVGIIAIGAGIAVAVSRRKKVPPFMEVLNVAPAPSSNTTLANSTTNPAPSPVTEYNDCTFPLRQGSKNRCVKLMQEALIKSFSKISLPKYGADGDWGKETTEAMILYTQANQIDTPEQLQAFLSFYNQ